MKDLEYWLWLSKLEISEKLKKDLIFKYKNPKEIYELLKTELKDLHIKKETIDIFKSYIKYMINNNIKIITILSKEYPIKLLNIYDSPVVLFYKGNINLLNKKSISVVGCRQCSNYGKLVSKRLSMQLSDNNICIISGLAKGIDTCAHQASLNKQGKTIAVIGSGIDIVYPKENMELLENIIKNDGLVLSEYIIGTKPLRDNFPKRNRIISGLSDGVVIIEAASRSGALITADFALEQGKEVYVIPGNITSYNSYGTNELIKQGAKVVTNVNDILQDII